MDHLAIFSHHLSPLASESPRFNAPLLWNLVVRRATLGAMKQIVTVIRPHLAESLLTSLRRAPIEALSVVEVKGYGRQKSYVDEYQKTEYSEAFVPKVEITLWVDDSRCEEVIQKVVSLTRSGRIGDGKIFVMPVTTFI